MKSVLTKRWASRNYNLVLRAPAASTRWCNSRPCSLLTFFSSPLEKESRQAQITTKQRRQPIREVRHYPGTSCGAAAGEWCLSDRGGPGKEGVKAHLESGTEQMSKGGKKHCSRAVNVLPRPVATIYSLIKPRSWSVLSFWEHYFWQHQCWRDLPLGH